MMLQTILSGSPLLYITFRVIDLLDILFVAFLLYIIFKLIRKTVAMNIFAGILAIYVVWKIVTVFQMELLSEILGQFISVGVIALLIVFQPELRKFLLLLGTPKFMPEPISKLFSFRVADSEFIEKNIETVLKAAENMSKEQTGALLILVRYNKLPDMVSTGVEINAKASTDLICSIFFKNNPLHDGAMIIDNDKIRAARCILPVSGNKDIPAHCGLRHRAAIGITEQSDAIAIAVSEENGSVSMAVKGEIQCDISLDGLREKVVKEMIK